MASPAGFHRSWARGQSPRPGAGTTRFQIVLRGLVPRLHIPRFEHIPSPITKVVTRSIEPLDVRFGSCGDTDQMTETGAISSLADALVKQNAVAAVTRAARAALRRAGFTANR